jgi:two-component system response regulator RegA
VVGPAWKSAFRRNAMTTMTDKNSKNKCVLLVDDDPVFLQVLGRSLQKRGYDVVTSGGIEDAIKQARESKPAMAVVDLKLEGESGLDLIPKLTELNAEMNIVVLTGYSSIATAVTAIKRGASDYLSKPVTASDVIRALKGQRSQDVAPEDFSPMSVERVEWEHIQKVLKENDGNISATARSLGMYRRTLQRKLAKKPVSE